MTIRLRLALLFASATLLLLVGGGILFVTRLEAGLESNLTTALTSRADGLISQLGTAPSATANSSVERRALIRGGNGSYVQLLSTRGQVLDSSRAIADTSLLTPAQIRAASTRTLVFDNTVGLALPGDSGPEPMRVLAKRAAPSNDVVAIAISRDVVDKAVAGSREQLLILGIAVLLLAGPGSWLLTRAALRPVERMRLEVADLDARTADAGVHVPDSRDEIARLGHTFNGLLGRLHDALSREQALVADAGHELRTPLTVLKGELELARRPGRTHGELVGTVEVAAEETDRLVRLTEDLLFLSGDDQMRDLHARPFDLTAVVGNAVAGLAAARSVDIVVATGEPVWTTGNADWIRQAVDNLLINASRHAPPGTAVTVTVSRQGPTTRVSVADEGPGFPPQFLPVAFNRFTRADSSRARTAIVGRGDSGNGLGLAIVHSVISRHGGTATAANRPHSGAEVVLTWPSS